MIIVIFISHILRYEKYIYDASYAFMMLPMHLCCYSYFFRFFRIKILCLSFDSLCILAIVLFAICTYKIPIPFFKVAFQIILFS